MGRRGHRVGQPPRARPHRRRPRAHAQIPGGRRRAPGRAGTRHAARAVAAVGAVLAVALSGLWLGGSPGGDPAADAVTAQVSAAAGRDTAALPVGEAGMVDAQAQERIRRAQPEAARREQAAEERAWRQARPKGTYAVVPGRDRVAGVGDVVRYMVEVERGLPVDRAGFAAEVHRTLNARGGWGKGGRTMRFVRVDEGSARFRVALSSPELTDRQCAPLRTYGRVSCFNGRRAVLNSTRWRLGSPTYGKDVAGYRIYLVNHEVGHALGRDHVGCPERKEPAPVMVQQTKSLEGCRANPWPFPGRAVD